MLQLANHFGTDLVGCLLKAGYPLFSKCGWFEQDFFVLLHLSRLHQGVSLIGRSRGLRKTLPSEELFLKLPLGREANILLAPSCLASLSLLSLAHTSLGTIVDGYIRSICGTHDRALDHGYKARSFMRLNINPLKETELVLYGGEFYNGNKDFWVLETNQWEQLNYKGCHSPRSGHRMWQEIKSTSGCMWPSARSGFQDEGNDQLE
ncbi:hypothetical protein T459_10072 [Capsicum annuum]|uniref:Uncharacterized protein n=1 Tax=Capsicum annuum TaxID=4072 RepID=A0A2G3A188_CAPAN|nr:hypothetical protein T459_10072 [Capsicum annuum]